MRRVLLACLLGMSFALGGCFSPKIDLGDLGGLVKVQKKDGDKEGKEDKDKGKDKKDD